MTYGEFETFCRVNAVDGVLMLSPRRPYWRAIVRWPDGEVSGASAESAGDAMQSAVEDFILHRTGNQND